VTTASKPLPIFRGAAELLSIDHIKGTLFRVGSSEVISPNTGPVLSQLLNEDVIENLDTAHDALGAGTTSQIYCKTLPRVLFFARWHL
jgi:hypothetical protein